MCFCAACIGVVSFRGFRFGLNVNFAKTKFIVAGVGASAGDGAALVSPLLTSLFLQRALGPNTRAVTRGQSTAA